MPRYTVTYSGQQNIIAKDEAEAIQRARYEIPSADFQVIAITNDPNQTEIEFDPKFIFPK